MKRPDSGNKGRKPRKNWHRRTCERGYLTIAWPDTGAQVDGWGEPQPLRQGLSGFKKRHQRS